MIGYPLTTSIFIPLFGNIEGSSRVVTIPYRIFALTIVLITIILNIKKKIYYSLPLKLFFLFWLTLLLRIYYDLEIRTEYIIPTIFKEQIWLVAIGICFLPMFALAKSIKSINFDLCLKYLFVSSAIILTISFFTSVQSTSNEERIQGNIALDSISLGQSSIVGTIVSIYLIITKKKSSFLQRLSFAIFGLLGIYIALRSGSRGPLIALLLVLIFWFSFKEKRLIKAILIFSISILSIYIFQDLIIQSISIISPVTSSRMNEAISGNDLSVLNRQESYMWFLNKIYENPIFGSQFARLTNGEYPGYAHNIFLDILLGFGILGLVVFLFIIAKSLLVVRESIISNNNFWIGLIFIQFFMLSISSGAFYSDPMLNVLVVLLQAFYGNIANKQYKIEPKLYSYK